MALKQGFAGFGFKTPSMVRDEMMQGLQQAAQSGNVNVSRMALAQNAANLLVKSPAMREAQKKQDAIMAAQKATPKTGDPRTDQKAFYENVQKNALDEGLPEITMQATEHLAVLQTEDEERERLQTKDQREEVLFERAVDNFKKEDAQFEQEQYLNRLERAHKGTAVLVDSSTGTSTGNYDLTNMEDIAAMSAQMKENPDLQFTTMENYLDMTADQRSDMAKMRAVGRSGAMEMRTLSAQGIAMNEFAITSDNFMNVLEEGPGSFGVGGKALGALDQAGAHARSFVAAINPEMMSENDQRLTSAIDRAGIDNAQRKAMVMDLAYALATSREGGRLTDQDIDRAILTLGVDEPNPAAIAAVFGDLIKRRATSWNDRLKLSGLIGDEKAEISWGVPQGRLQALDARMTEYRSQFDDQYTLDAIDAEIAAKKSGKVVPPPTEVVPQNQTQTQIASDRALLGLPE